jgi:energy-coupling factor transporter ATP-binding protein EcfA2
LPVLSAAENVELPLLLSGVAPRKARVQSLRALPLVGLPDKAASRPAELSGGQRQRVAIARALVNEPAIVFADEPTGALDSGSAGAIMDLLVRLNNEQGQTVAMVTHDAGAGARADRVVRFRDGAIVGEEPAGGRRQYRPRHSDRASRLKPPQPRAPAPQPGRGGAQYLRSVQRDDRASASWYAPAAPLCPPASAAGRRARGALFRADAGRSGFPQRPRAERVPAIEAVIPDRVAVRAIRHDCPADGGSGRGREHPPVTERRAHHEGAPEGGGGRQRRQAARPAAPGGRSLVDGDPRASGHRFTVVSPRHVRRPFPRPRRPDTPPARP